MTLPLILFHNQGRGRPIGGDGLSAYAIKVLTYSPIAYWQLNEKSGTDAICSVNAAQNGTYARDVSTMGTVTGIGDGNTAPTFDGTQDVVDVYSATLAAAYSQTTFTISVWFKVFNVGVWTDATNRKIARFYVDDNNQFGFYGAGNSTLYVVDEAGGTEVFMTDAGHAETGWVHAAITLDEVSNNIIFYLDGSVVDNDTNAGTWAGTIHSAASVIGANNTTPTNPWHGHLAHPAIFTSVLTPTQILDSVSYTHLTLPTTPYV